MFYRYKSYITSYKKLRRKYKSVEGAKYCLGPADFAKGIDTIAKKLEKDLPGFARLEALFGGRQNIKPCSILEMNADVEEKEEEKERNYYYDDDDDASLPWEESEDGEEGTERDDFPISPVPLPDAPEPQLQNHGGAISSVMNQVECDMALQDCAAEWSINGALSEQQEGFMRPIAAPVASTLFKRPTFPSDPVVNATGKLLRNYEVENKEAKAARLREQRRLYALSNSTSSSSSSSTLLTANSGESSASMTPIPRRRLHELVALEGQVVLNREEIQALAERDVDAARGPDGVKITTTKGKGRGGKGKDFSTTYAETRAHQLEFEKEKFRWGRVTDHQEFSLKKQKLDDDRVGGDRAFGMQEDLARNARVLALDLKEREMINKIRITLIKEGKTAQEVQDFIATMF